MDGSTDSTTIRPPRPLRMRFVEPSDSSTARTVAWSPPTRAWETERWAVTVPPATGADALTGGRYRARALRRDLRLTRKESTEPRRRRPGGGDQAGGGVGRGRGCSACLSLGLGTQPAGLWATTCCVPAGVITPNVAAVKPLHISDGLRLDAQADRTGQDPDPGQQADRDTDIDRGQHTVNRPEDAADDCADRDRAPDDCAHGGVHAALHPVRRDGLPQAHLVDVVDGVDPAADEKGGDQQRDRESVLGQWDQDQRQCAGGDADEQGRPDPDARGDPRRAQGT